ncbi:hypothetical protein GTA51_15720 [Desulfovibrio aerotolerans]|uniref:Uncharacterized protein n=1 Tax=Solidesulfovibrio aerotolerans TaxID=295255 RepID=A0A7C9MKU7_9BACT|nr:hypothetical protein [Solidesulfovibrio aerotolerans]MYL84569.1 hypothetical protein [Solidesulfovibrio aerotolerans]
MKDTLGLYYYPNPAEKRVRMYVRVSFGQVEFRLWNSEHAAIWERHDWIPYADIEAAAAEYKKRGTGTDPLELYDLNVAKRLLADEGVPCP